MKKAKDLTRQVTFQKVKLTYGDGSQPVKRLDKCLVTVDSKQISLGNFYAKWKHIERLEIQDNGYLEFTDCKPNAERTIVCEHIINASDNINNDPWDKFQQLVEKFNSKHTAKKNNYSEELPTAAYSGQQQRNKLRRRKEERKAYGVRGRRLGRTIKEANSYDDDLLTEVRSGIFHLEKPHEDVELLLESVPADEDDLVQESEDEEVIADSTFDEEEKIQDTTTPVSSRQQQGRRRLRKHIVTEMDNSDSDDDDEFERAADVTTPNLSQRVVSPYENGHSNRNKENNKDKKNDQKEATAQKGTIDSFFLKAVGIIESHKCDLPQNTMKSHDKTLAVRATGGVKGKNALSVTPKSTIATSPRRPHRQELLLPNPAQSPKPRTPEKDAKTPQSTRKRIPSSWRSLDRDDDDENDMKDKRFPHDKPHLSASQSGLKKRKLVENAGYMNTILPSRASFPQTPSRIETKLQEYVGPYRGFRNIGNTCFVNSSLQMLYTVRAFVQGIQGKGGELVRSVVTTAQNVANISIAGAASAKAVKIAMDKKTDKFIGSEQRDAHEFLGDLIDNIHEELLEERHSQSEVEVVSASTPMNTEEAQETAQSSEKALTVPNCDDQSSEKDRSPSCQDDGIDAKSTHSAVEAQFSVQSKREMLPTDAFFRCDIEVCLTCNECGYFRTKQEMYRHLSLDISHHETPDKDVLVSVQNSLELFFKPEEREIKCEKCDGGETASQTLRLISRPRALLLHLKRFEVVQQEDTDSQPANASGRRAFDVTLQKNKAPVELSKQVSLEKFLLENNGNDTPGPHEYSLKSLVYHIGARASSGHYTADALRERMSKPSEGASGTKENAESSQASENKTEWVSFDDSSTSVTNLQDILSDRKRQSTAYMLLYTLD